MEEDTRRLPQLGRLAMLLLLMPFLLTCKGTTGSIWSTKLSDLENRRQIYEERTGRAQPSDLGRASGRGGEDRFGGIVQVGSGSFVSSGPSYALESRDDGGSGVTLNLLDVSVPKAISVVLGEILGLNYLIDDRVHGTMTLQTTRPVSPDALVDILESTLAAHGAGIVRNAGIYRVVPAEEAVMAGIPLSVGSKTPKGPGIQYQVVEVQHLSAEEIANVLEPLAAPGAILRVDSARNLLILAGNRAELATMRETVGVFDVDWMKGMSFALHPVRTSDPQTIAQELDTIFATESGPLKNVVRFVPNNRLGAVLVMSSRPQYLSEAAGWIARLDRAARTNEVQLFVYDIQNRDATQMAELLQSIIAARGQSGAEAGAVAPKLDPIVVARRDRDDIVAAAAPGPANAVTTASGSSVWVVADQSNNSLLIYSSPNEYDQILPILKRLDVLPTQVLLEAVIAEVTLNDELRFGLRWFFESGRSRFRFSDIAGIAEGVIAASTGFSWMFAAANVKIMLEALSTVTDVNVISSPTLMVLDNHTATLQVGAQVPMVTREVRSIENPAAPVVNSVELKDTGVILTVTPRVNDSGRVMLNISQEVSEVVRTTTSGIDSPTIQQRKLSTSVVVNDGESVALGGLMQESISVGRRKIPVLGDIPLLGNAFQQKANGIRRTELLIFIQPRVVRDINEARAVTDEYRRQLDLRGPNAPGRAGERMLRDINRLAH